ncbi:hypothetical protein BSLG_000265 [Batrachochytrium salamandrivorans]|nr:hypothetical protein BSLG_000265 [Batrachochytrium salamandrivorans]
MTAFQQTLYDLERRHQTMKLQNDEEIARLRRELEIRGIPIPPPVQISSSSIAAAGSGGAPQQAGAGGGVPAGHDARAAASGHRSSIAPQQQHQQQQLHQQQLQQQPHQQQQMAKAGFPEGVPPPVLSQPRQSNGGVFGALIGNHAPPQMQQPHSSAASPPPNSYVHPGSGNGPPSLGPTPGSDLGGGHLVGMDGHPSKRQRPDEPGLSGPPTQRQKQLSLAPGGGGGSGGNSSLSLAPPHSMKMGPAPPISTVHPSMQHQHSQPQQLQQQHSPAHGPPHGGGPGRMATTSQSTTKQGAPAMAQQQPQPAPPSHPVPPPAHTIEEPPTTGYIDFEARKSSEEGKITGEDYACFVNPLHSSVSNIPLHVEPLRMFNLHSVVCCVKFSNDGQYLGIGCSKSAEIYDVKTFQRVCMLTDDTTRKDYYIRSVVFSPDGRFIASGAEDHLVRICDIEQQSIKLRLPGHQLDIYSIDWSRDGKFIASASGDRTVKIWDPVTGACTMTLSCDDDSAHSAPGADAPKDAGLTSVAIRPSDSRCVAAGAIDDTIRLWDAVTGQLLERFVGHQNSVYAVAFSPTGLSLVSGSLDKTLRIWDISPETSQYLKSGTILTPAEIATRSSVINSKPRHLFRGHKDFILSVAFPGKGSSLGTVDRQGRPLPPNLTPGLGEIDWIVSSSKDRHVTLWDASLSGSNPTAVPVCLVSGHRNSVISVAVSSVGGLLATGSGDMRTRLWRVSCDTTAGDVPPPAEMYSKGGYHNAKGEPDVKSENVSAMTTNAVQPNTSTASGSAAVSTFASAVSPGTKAPSLSLSAHSGNSNGCAALPLPNLHPRPHQPSVTTAPGSSASLGNSITPHTPRTPPASASPAKSPAVTSAIGTTAATIDNPEEAGALPELRSPATALKGDTTPTERDGETGKEDATRRGSNGGPPNGNGNWSWS